MENNKASSAAWPAKKSSIEWVLELTRAAIKTNLPPDMKSPKPPMALENGMLWVHVASAGALLLAMLFNGRGRGHRMIRRALAWVSLAFTVALHCAVIWLLGLSVIITVDTDWPLITSIVTAVGFIFFAVFDVNAALGLLGRRGWDWED